MPSPQVWTRRLSATGTSVLRKIRDAAHLLRDTIVRGKSMGCLKSKSLRYIYHHRAQQMLRLRKIKPLKEENLILTIRGVSKSNFLFQRFHFEYTQLLL